MAAAYAALISLFNNLELIQNHPRHSFRFEDKQIRSLRQSVCSLIDFMQSCDYDGEDLERRIASAAHAAEDVLESHVVDQIHSGSTLGERKPCRFLLDLQKVIENMEFVSRKALQVKKAHGGFKAEQPAHSVSSTPLFSEKSNNTMVGFEDVSRQLLDLLTRESSSREVIPIVGMGGAGKTTLARNAFEHKLTMHHFDVCLWATISQRYSVKEILFHRKSAAGESETVYKLEQLHEMLWRRRYFVVLDDIWSVEAWDEIQLYLPDDDNKSRIVLTTRQSNVAECIGPSYLKLNPLDKDKSWNLFCEKAFAEKVCPPELEDIGKKIVKKCKGLPLAIVVVGGHLGKSSRMKEYWQKVANNFHSVLDSGDENERCLDILSLSYSYLPVQLKPCFVYMGAFQEDEEIRMLELIQLWIAEGFIKSDNNNSEEVAEDYLKHLIERNLVIADKAYKCRIHDLLRELCLKMAEKEKFFHHVLSSTPRAECRVLIVQDPQIIQAPISAPTVRSLKCQGAAQLPLDLRLLRVQNKVGRASTNEVDGGFLERNLQHLNLRYLCCSKDDRDFWGYSATRLPPSISRLWNLQTLIVKGVYAYVIAPYEIWEMPQLRHLKFNRIFLPDPHPCHSFDQPLGLQYVGYVANLRLSEEVCKRIPDIKVLWLRYFYSGRVCDEPKSHYSLDNLGRLHKLEKLVCSFSVAPEWRDLALSLTFPSSLKELTLTNPHLQWEELTMMLGFLPHLHSLYLREVKAGPEWNPVEGGFPILKSLFIVNCPDLICWNADNSHFPVLERLLLRDLSKLDNFPSGLGEIPTLEYIHLEGCSVSLAISALRMLVEQEEQGNDVIQLVVNFRKDLKKQKSFEKQMEEEGLKSDHLHQITALATKKIVATAASLIPKEIVALMLVQLIQKHCCKKRARRPPRRHLGARRRVTLAIFARRSVLGGRRC